MEVKANEKPAVAWVELSPEAVLYEIERETEKEGNDHSDNEDCLIFWAIDLLSYKLGWLV